MADDARTTSHRDVLSPRDLEQLLRDLADVPSPSSEDAAAGILPALAIAA